MRTVLALWRAWHLNSLLLLYFFAQGPFSAVSKLICIGNIGCLACISAAKVIVRHLSNQVFSWRFITKFQKTSINFPVVHSTGTTVNSQDGKNEQTFPDTRFFLFLIQFSFLSILPIGRTVLDISLYHCRKHNVQMVSSTLFTFQQIALEASLQVALDS